MKQQPTTTDREKAKQFYEVFKESFCDEVSTRLTDDQKEVKVGIQAGADLEISNGGPTKKIPAKGGGYRKFILKKVCCN